MDQPASETGARERWPAGYRAALCLCVDVSEPAGDDELAPLVPESWYERAGADRLLRVLADTGVSATFTWSRPGPISFDLIEHVQDDGHEVAARARDDRVPAADWAADLTATRRALAARTGSEITGCRAVGQAARAEFRHVVRELGFHWLIDQPYSDLPIALRSETETPPLVHLPTSRWFDDRRLFLNQSLSARQAFEVWRDDLDTLRDEGGLLCLILHPSVGGRPGPSRAVALLLDVAIEAGDLWIATAGAVAAWWSEAHAAV
jgi:peptidoglycan/xylan/chitin deacetylase (PgdA/CDA1 family)